MNKKIRRSLIIACALVTIFVSIGATKAFNANGLSADNFMPGALVSYEHLMSKATTTEDVYFSDTIIQLVEERQSFYQRYFSEGLNSDLVKIESEFDQTTMKQTSSGEIEVIEIVNLTGIPKLQNATDYPPYQAALLASKVVGGKDQECSNRIDAYARNILEAVQQSIDEGEFTFSIINKHTMTVDYEKGIVLTDSYSSESVDDPGTDKVVLLQGKPTRVEPDFSLLPDHMMYVTPIDELANALIDNLSTAPDAYSNSSGVYLTSTGSTAPLSYSGSSAAAYIRTYVRPTSITCSNGVTLQNTLNYNPAYEPYPCLDCASYVSQALVYGGMDTTTEWHYDTGAWKNVTKLQNYIISGDYGNIVSCSLVGLGDLGMIPDTHVVMVSALNPLRYSGHTNDRYNYPWQASLTRCINMF